MWTHHSQKGKGWLEQGDIEEAMNAAAKIGDDTLQRASQGTVVPESFTHGSSEQRMRWFQKGLQGGPGEWLQYPSTRASCSRGTPTRGARQPWDPMS